MNSSLGNLLSDLHAHGGKPLCPVTISWNFEGHGSDQDLREIRVIRGLHSLSLSQGD